MTATTHDRSVVCQLASELSSASGGQFGVGAWQEAVDGAGGEARARWLITNTPLAEDGRTPAALIVAHTVARLLELGPPAQVPRRMS